MNETSFHNGKMVCICQVASAHGVKGEVKLYSFMEDRLNIKSFPILYDEDGNSYEIKITGLFKNDLLIARLNGMTDRATAERLKGRKLYVKRESLPQIGDEEYYHTDLIGLDVVTTKGDNIGKINAVHNFGAGDILEVKKGGNSLMLPFNRDIVTDIDITAGRAVCLPLEDIFIEAGDGAEAG